MREAITMTAAKRMWRVVWLRPGKDVVERNDVLYESKEVAEKAAAEINRLDPRARHWVEKAS